MYDRKNLCFQCVNLVQEPHEGYYRWNQFNKREWYPSSVSFYCKLTLVSIRTVRKICKDFVSVKQRTLGGGKIMVNIKQYLQETWEGKIVKIEEATIRDFVKPEFIDKFKGPDKAAMQITIEVLGDEVKHMVTIPKVAGYMKSNLKKIIDKNKLPDDTKKWIGKTVNMAVDKKGFLHIAL